MVRLSVLLLFVTTGSIAKRRIFVSLNSVNNFMRKRNLPAALNNDKVIESKEESQGFPQYILLICLNTLSVSA